MSTVFLGASSERQPRFFGARLRPIRAPPIGLDLGSNWRSPALCRHCCGFRRETVGAAPRCSRAVLLDSVVEVALEHDAHSGRACGLRLHASHRRDVVKIGGGSATGSLGDIPSEAGLRSAAGNIVRGNQQSPAPTLPQGNPSCSLSRVDDYRPLRPAGP